MYRSLKYFHFSYIPVAFLHYDACTYTIKQSHKRYRYTGKERDEETGFYYHGARYYVPWIARWVASEPLYSEWYNVTHGHTGLSQKRDFEELTPSPYEYCFSNPVKFNDPKGENPSTIVDEKGKVVGGTTADNDKGVYSVKGLTADKFNVNDIDRYKSIGIRLGETYSLNSFLTPEDNVWRGQINSNHEAGNNIRQATITFGNFMKNHNLLQSSMEYAGKAGNGGYYDIKSWGIKWDKATQDEKFEHVYQASYYGKTMIMTRRDQGNFFAGRVANMLGFSDDFMLSGFGAYQNNNNNIKGTWNKTKVGVMGILNYLNQQILGFAISGTPAQDVLNVKPIFRDDKVSEDLQIAGYKQFLR